MDQLFDCEKQYVEQLVRVFAEVSPSVGYVAAHQDKIVITLMCGGDIKWCVIPRSEI